MRKTKVLSAFLAALLALSAVSCGDGGSSEKSSEEKTTAAETTEETGAEEETEAESKPEEETEAETEAETDAPAEDGTVSFLDYIEDVPPTPPMWLVTDPATGNQIYMLGTIHVAADSTFELPDYLMDVYNSCDSIAVEYNTHELENDFEQLMEFSQSFIYTDGTTIADHISQESYEGAKAVFSEYGAYSATLDYFCPSYWATNLLTLMLTNITDLSTEGVDSYFLTLAENDGKEIVNIEPLSAQISAINCYSDEFADYMIADFVNTEDVITETAASLGELYNAWASGDMAKVEAYDEKSSEDIPEEFMEEYEASNYQQVTYRNIGMADRAEEFLKNGDNILFMVGTLHYAGDEGVDDLLAAKGYTVEQIN